MRIPRDILTLIGPSTINSKQFIRQFKAEGTVRENRSPSAYPSAAWLTPAAG